MATYELSSAPSLLSLYGKALAGQTVSQARRRLPVLSAGQATAPDSLPETSLLLAGRAVDRDELGAYDRVCAFAVGDKVPATYPHVLAFPLAMKLMTSPEFPFSVIGLVHLRNRIWQLRPLSIGERLDIEVWSQGLADHAGGKQFDILSQATVDGEPVWRSESTYLHRQRTGSKSSSKPGHSEQSLPEPTAIWDVGGDVGRRYAAVSGDRNPIHMHPLAARAFGFDRAIAHGMWIKARCLAALDDLLADAFEVEVSFARPIKLPAQVAFASWPENTGHGFAVSNPTTTKPYITGSVEIPLTEQK